MMKNRGEYRTGMSGRLRVAAYIRVSADVEEQENSYEVQECYFNRLLNQNAEWESAGVYSDYGISGTSRQKRTGFERLLRHCREGRIDRIITKSISRFARNTVDFVTALEVLREAGITIFFEKEGLDTANLAGSFVLTTLAAIAQDESRSISSNINWGNQKRFLRGDVRNQDIYGYRFTEEYTVTESGYRCREVAVVEEEAEVVRWIFRKYVAGMGFKELARNLNYRHIPVKRSCYTERRMQNPAKGQLHADLEEGWTAGQIGDLLRNERYTGDVLIQKTYTENYLTHKVRKNKGEVNQYFVRDHHPAIISRELFEEAVKRREVSSSMRHHYGERASRAFSGKLICGSCGRFYHVRNTKYHPIWFCPSAARQNGMGICKNGKVYEEQLIRMLRKAISGRFQLAAVQVWESSEAEDILNGCYKSAGEQSGFFTGEAADFVGQALAGLVQMQQTDFMERDRAFLKRRQKAAREAVEHARSCEDGAKLAGAEEEGKKWDEQLVYMEEYWEELEADYVCRKKTIEWMRGLPQGVEGVIAFLNGMTDTYVRAFILSVTIRDAFHYTVHWFDDTRTEVEMDTNIEDYRRTAVCSDRQAGWEKKAGRR